MSTDLSGLIERVRKATGPNNSLDIEIDIALFVPNQTHASVKANSASTKLVYTRHNGVKDTFWAQDHTLNATRRKVALVSLLALQSQDKDHDQ